MAILHKIAANLWFDSEVLDAAKFYTSIFMNSGIGQISYYGKEGFEIHGRTEGSVMTVTFTLEGQEFVGLNGGPVFKFNEAVSFIIYCVAQGEVDYYWDKLTEGGDKQAQQCGWLKDKYGLSWQVVPVAMLDMLRDTDRDKAGRVMAAMMRMQKIDIGALERAYVG